MKNFSYFLLCLAVIFSVSIAKAQTVSTWDGTAAIWTHGNGTQADPYLIESAQNLAWIAEMVNGGVATYAGVWFKLTTDLNMNNIAWVPIGNSTTNLFQGKFDGDNHFIDNISITGNYTYLGLFGITGDGFRCENLGVNTNILVYRSYGGGIVAYTTGANTIIQHCYNTGTLQGGRNGGIVGVNNATGTQIISCNNFGNTASGSNGGGIVGENAGALYIYSCSNFGDNYRGGIVCKNTNTLNIQNCFNTRDVSTATNHSSGGIVGENASTLNIYNCYNTGNVTATTSESCDCSCYYSKYSYSGGMIGYSEGTLNIYNCYNRGIISSTTTRNCTTIYGKAYSYAGGIIGFGDALIVNCYNRGAVKANASTTPSSEEKIRVSGGIRGSGAGTIKNCYNTGTLNGTGGTKGGIRGSGGAVTNCYYLSTCGGTVSGGTSKTEAEMKSASFPILLNADSTIYVMDGTPTVNNGYPIFGNGTYPLSQDANQVLFHSAKINGIYYGSADVVGFEYKKSSDSKFTTVYVNVGTPATHQLSGLQSGTAYTYRFFVQKDGLNIYGGNKTFSTLACDLQASISKSTTTICQGDTATFTVAGSSNHSNAFTYEWENGSTDTSIIVTNDASYTVTAHDTNGCSATASASVTVNPVPQGNISGYTTLCSGQSTTLTASGANSYHWNTGATAPVITVNTSGDYTCTFTNSYGCTATQTVTVNVFSEPIITGNTALCDGGSTTLTATGGDSYQWSTGATTASINVNTAGNYSVTASTSNGCSGSASVTVIQNEASEVVISGNTEICSGIGTLLTASSGTDYLWSTGETTQAINVNNPGIYSVTVTNNNGCSDSSSQMVTMMEPTVISGSTQICQGQNTTLLASGSGSYTWSNGASTSFITVNMPGNYTVTVTLPNGCSSSATVNVSVGTTPTPVILGNTTLCQGQSTTLTANGGSSYVWDNGNTSNSNTVSQSGVYTVTATNAEGCTGTVTVTVSVNPLPTITVSGSTTLCAGNSTTLTASGADSYSWSTGDNTASVSISAFGVYTVTGTSTAGCSNTANVTVLVSQPPVITISGETDICAGESTTLTANGGETYLWSNGTTDNTLTVNLAGTYQVIGYNAAGCSSMADATVNVWQPATSEFTVECPDPCYEWNGESYCQSGDYTQTLQTVHGCDSVVTLHLTITVGIEDHDFAASMTVYPNPTNGIVNVQFTDNNSPITQIHVLDIYGKLLGVVETQNFASLQTAQIDLSRYANGVYFIKAVANGNEMGIRKVVKQ